jgi:hypothetical protein
MGNMLCIPHYPNTHVRCWKLSKNPPTCLCRCASPRVPAGAWVGLWVRGFSRTCGEMCRISYIILRFHNKTSASHAYSHTQNPPSGGGCPASRWAPASLPHLYIRPRLPCASRSSRCASTVIYRGKGPLLLWRYMYLYITTTNSRMHNQPLVWFV